MKHKDLEYCIYQNGKSKAVLPTESEAFEYLKRSALRHPEAEFAIEKRELIFDSFGRAQDKKRLSEFRKPKRDNTIHASIHACDWDIGTEDIG
jgi:hypothetical protein